MIKIKNIVEKSKQLKLTKNNSYGGFITYWKLYFKFLKLTKQSWKLLNFFQKIEMITEVTIKTPYWLLIKPLGWMFSTKTTYQADLTQKQADETIIDFKIHSYYKTKTYKVMSIPFFYYWSYNPSKNDILVLKDQMQK